MAGRKRRSPSGLSIVNNSRKYNTRKTCKDDILTAKSEVGDGVLSFEYRSFFLLNPKDVDRYSESLLKEALSIYTTELPAMNYAANTGKESQFLERCLSNGKYRTLILKSNCIKGPKEGVGQLIYKELRRRLQSVGVSTIFCWADKESEGFWSKQGFISIGEVNTKGRICKLPIKADVRRALSFPGGSILMVANLTDDAKVSVNSFEHATMNLPLKADSPQIEEGRECQHVMNSNLLNENGVPNSVNGDVRNSQHQLSTNDISAPNKQQHEGFSPSGPMLQGVAGFFPCSRTGYINLETLPEVSNDKHGLIGGRCCSCSGNNTEDRVWEATLSSLKSKRVKGVKSSNPKLDYEIDSRNDMFFGGCPSCTHPSSSLVKVVPDDPQQGSVLMSPLEGNDPTHNTAEDQSNDDLTSRKECPRIMFMNIADESKKTCLANESAGGTVIRRLDNIKEPSKTIFLACEEDTEEAVAAAKRGIWTYGSDWFMNCVMKQELDFDAPHVFEGYTAISDFRILNRRKLIECPDINPYLSINISSNSLGLSDDENVTVTVSGVLVPDESDWIGMISPSSSDVSDCPLNSLLYKETGDTSDLPLLCHYPVKAQYVSNDPAYLGCKKEDCKEDAATNGTCSVKTCSGSVSFHIVNIRTDVEFVFFSGGFKTPCILKRSDPVKFANPNNALVRSPFQHRLYWDIGSIPSPAKDFGWHEPGYIHSAVMTDLVPSQSFSYKYGRDFANSGSVYLTPDSGGECGVAYESYFQMPASGKDKPWYSIEQASVHFTIISTEHNWTQGSEQYDWIKSDLGSINRARTPWVIFAGHRPIYSSNSGGFLPSVDPDFVKSIEPLLLDNKVSNAWSLSRYAEFGYVRVHATKEDLRVEFVNSTTTEEKMSIAILISLKDFKVTTTE
ncbi:putative inactive purple acid phosphatase 27 [Acorus calamus]|uniref:Inactive purple acid phosphatase 27 n=1 Tax=Acorus calamus TaxID=4465 RepID=A0AAV9CR75_ACOCL|nr:putative inactive purple acid phosphatase 27 [Acorus calamus]